MTKSGAPRTELVAARYPADRTAVLRLIAKRKRHTTKSQAVQEALDEYVQRHAVPDDLDEVA